MRVGKKSHYKVITLLSRCKPFLRYPLRIMRYSSSNYVRVRNVDKSTVYISSFEKFTPVGVFVLFARLGNPFSRLSWNPFNVAGTRYRNVWDLYDGPLWTSWIMQRRKRVLERGNEGRARGSLLRKHWSMNFRACFRELFSSASNSVESFAKFETFGASSKCWFGIQHRGYFKAQRTPRFSSLFVYRKFVDRLFVHDSFSFSHVHRRINSIEMVISNV